MQTLLTLYKTSYLNEEVKCTVLTPPLQLVFPANGIISICVAAAKEAKTKTVVIADKRGKNLQDFPSQLC